VKSSSTETILFGNISLSKKVHSAITEMGFEEPSPIQSQTIPILMEGHDVIGQAQTGTGKTAAFGIPIIERMTDARNIQALVITPTRELAIQVAEEIAKIGKFKRVKTLAVYGGQSIDRQIRAMHFGVQVVIGTPGRLLDHISRGTIKLQSVKMLVLDEADEMLDMGFVEDIESILKYIPGENRQTLLFSATMPAPIAMLARRYMKDPINVSISREQLTVPLTDQFYYEITDKLDGLCRVLDAETMGRLIIFCRTKKGVDELVSSLQARGYMADGLHGDLSQVQRDRVMKKFRDGKLEILIATDVAARGLDIEQVTHVVNYDIPQDPEAYVHRIGRTGRAGHKGTAITFINPREFRQLKLIEHMAKTRILRRQLPSPTEVLDRRREMIKKNLINIIEQGKYADYQKIVADLAEQYDALDIAAAALKLFQEGVKSASAVEEKTTFSNTGGAPGMVRLFINIGKAQKIRPEDFIRTIASEADIAGSQIGIINIYEKFSFVEVAESVAERVISVMHKNSIKGYKINVEPAKAR